MDILLGILLWLALTGSLTLAFHDLADTKA